MTNKINFKDKSAFAKPFRDLNFASLKVMLSFMTLKGKQSVVPDLNLSLVSPLDCQMMGVDEGHLVPHRCTSRILSCICPQDLGRATKTWKDLI